MKNIIKRLAAKLIIATVLVVALAPNLSAVAYYSKSKSYYNYSTPQISSDYTYKDSSGKLRLHYCLSDDAYVTAGIYKAKGSNSSTTVKLLTSYDFRAEGCHTEKWNKSYNTAKNTDYLFYGINASAVGNKSKDDYVSAWIGDSYSTKKTYYDDYSYNNNYYYDNSNDEDYYDGYEDGYDDGYEDGWYHDDYEYDYDDNYYYDDYYYDDDYYYYDEYDNDYYYSYDYGNKYNKKNNKKKNYYYYY